MAAIFSQVRSDAVGARFDCDERGAQRIGQRAAARIAHSRDMIDVDPQSHRGHFQHSSLFQDPLGNARLPGLTAGIFANSGGSASAP